MKHRMSMLLSSIVLLLCVAVTSCNPGENYGKVLDSRWRNVFGLKASDGPYRWFGYPVDNFGIATFYDPPAGQDWKDSDRICASWSCLELQDKLANMNVDDRLNVGGYADIGTGPSITLDETAKSQLGISVILPGLANLLNINAGVDWSKGITTTLSIGKAIKRSINRDKVRDFIEHHSTNQTLKNDYTNGRLAYVAADIVAQDIDVTIKVDKKLNASADAKLTQLAGSVFPKDSEIKVNGGPNTEGTYHITIKSPVVLAVQTRTQPSGGTLGASDNPGPLYDHPLPRPNIK